MTKMRSTKHKLPYKDTRTTYGKVTRTLHWLIALLILWQFVGMGLKLILGRQPIAAFFVGIHPFVGSALFILIVVRIIWALFNRSNRPAHAKGIWGIASRLGHLLLYIAMIFVPSAALLRAYGSERPFVLLGIEIFPARETPIEWTQRLGNALHGEIAWVLLALIAGHILMVLLHTIAWRDETLSRMLGKNQQK